MIEFEFVKCYMPKIHVRSPPFARWHVWNSNIETELRKRLRAKQSELIWTSNVSKNTSRTRRNEAKTNSLRLNFTLRNLSLIFFHRIFFYAIGLFFLLLAPLSPVRFAFTLLSYYIPRGHRAREIKERLKQEEREKWRLWNEINLHSFLNEIYVLYVSTKLRRRWGSLLNRRLVQLLSAIIGNCHQHAPDCDMLSEAVPALSLSLSTRHIHVVSFLYCTFCETPWYLILDIFDTRAGIRTGESKSWVELNLFSQSWASRNAAMSSIPAVTCISSAHFFYFIFFRFEDNTAKWNEAVALNSWKHNIKYWIKKNKAPAARSSIKNARKYIWSKETGRRKTA